MTKDLQSAINQPKRLPQLTSMTVLCPVLRAAQSTTTRADAQESILQCGGSMKAEESPRTPKPPKGKHGSTIRRMFRRFLRWLRSPFPRDLALTCIVPACEASEIARKANTLRKSSTGSTLYLTTGKDFLAWSRRFLSASTAGQLRRILSLPGILWCRTDPLDRQTRAESPVLLTVASFALP